MNKGRRKQIADIREKLEGLKVEIEQIQSDEQDYIDNMPENLQASEKAGRADEVVVYLEDAASSLDDAIDNLTSAEE